MWDVSEYLHALFDKFGADELFAVALVFHIFVMPLLACEEDFAILIAYKTDFACSTDISDKF